MANPNLDSSSSSSDNSTIFTSSTRSFTSSTSSEYEARLRQAFNRYMEPTQAHVPENPDVSGGFKIWLTLTPLSQPGTVVASATSKAFSTWSSMPGVQVNDITSTIVAVEFSDWLREAYGANTVDYGVIEAARGWILENERGFTRCDEAVIVAYEG